MEIDFLVRVSARMDFSAASKYFIVRRRLFFFQQEAPESDKIGIWPCSSVVIVTWFSFSISVQFLLYSICPFFKTVERGSE